MEQVIQKVKDVLKNNTFNAADFTGVTKESKTIFGTTVDMYKLVQKFPSGNNNKDFIVYLSQMMAVKEVRTLLDAGTIYIEVSGDADATIANMKANPVLTGKYTEYTDKRINILHWYVSEVGNPDPKFPEDYTKLVFSGGSAPKELTDLTALANKWVMFTVTPVDYFGVRGDEARSVNRVYVIGEEWRGGTFAWVDKNEDIFFTEGTDVKMLKSLTWPLTHVFTSQKFPDPLDPGNLVLLNPSNGSLYVPMGVDAVTSPYGALNDISGDKSLNWVVDKSINLATDITVGNSSVSPDIHMKAMDGNIVLYQYIELNASGAAVFQTDGMPKMITDGPVLTSQYGDILLDTGSRGDVTVQKYSVLNAGKDILLKPFGNVSIYQASLNAGGSVLLDTTGGSTYSNNNRDIIITDSLLSLNASAVTNRSMTIQTLDALKISNTVFNGNTSAASSLNITAPDGITISNTQSNTNFNDIAVKLNNDTNMTGGGWDDGATVTVPNGKELVLKASGSGKVKNLGALVLGDTGAVSFVTGMTSDLTNPLKITLSKDGTNSNEVNITTNYGRNVKYADSSDAVYLTTYGAFQNMGSGSTNLQFTVAKKSGVRNSGPDLCL